MLLIPHTIDSDELFVFCDGMDLALSSTSPWVKCTDLNSILVEESDSANVAIVRIASILCLDAPACSICTKNDGLREILVFSCGIK